MNAEKNSKNNSKTRGKIAILFFALLFVCGCLVFDDYGISSDEAYQRNHSLVMYNELFLKGKEYHTQTVDTESLPSLKEYGMNYGVILQLPLIFVEHLNGFEMTYREIYMMRHFYVFLWFFVSAIFFYRLSLILTEGDILEALLGTVIYVLSPRTLADSFYNIKDALCLALFTISLYYGVQLIRKFSLKTALFFVIFSAFCTASRIVGGIVIAICLLLLFVKSIIQGTWKRLLKYYCLIGFLFLIAFVLISPNTWNDIPGTILKIIQTFSNYTLWHANVLYMGEWISAMDLPWHYLFVWIGMTVPGIYLLLMIIGMLDSCVQCVTCKMKEINEHFWIGCMLLLIFIVPFAYVILVRPVLYNGWRHFYFMYAVIACFAVSGFHVIRKKASLILKSGIYLLLLIAFSYICIWIVKYHPYEYVYYNPWIKEYAAENFQRDYWYVSETDAFQYILDTDDSEDIMVFAYQGFTWIFDGVEGNRLRQESSKELADYVVSDENNFIESYLFEKKKDIIVDGMVIRSIYKRLFNPSKRYTIIVGEEQAEYEMNGIIWTQEDSLEENIYVGKLIERVESDMLAAIVSDISLLETGEMKLSISYDGKSWHTLSDFPDYSVFGNRISGSSLVHDIGYIKLSYDKKYTGKAEISIMLCEFSANMVGRLPEINPFIIDLKSNVVTDSQLYAIIDGNMGTRWTTPHQQPGMYFDVLLDDFRVVSGAVLKLGESPWDYPRNLQIYISTDGEQWEKLIITAVDEETYRFEPVACRYLRFELGDMQETVDSNWSVYELKLLTVLEED